MAYDEGLAERIRDVLGDHPAITEKKMFGGLAFMHDGHMFVGIIGDGLMARVGPDGYASALAQPHVREMDFTGKPLRGYVVVDPAGLGEDEELAHWVQACRAFVKSLPPKVPKALKASKAPKAPKASKAPKPSKAPRPARAGRKPR